MEEISSGQRGMKTRLREEFIVQGPDLTEQPWPRLGLQAG